MAEKLDGKVPKHILDRGRDLCRRERQAKAELAAKGMVLCPGCGKFLVRQGRVCAICQDHQAHGREICRECRTVVTKAGTICLACRLKKGEKPDGNP